MKPRAAPKPPVGARPRASTQTGEAARPRAMGGLGKAPEAADDIPREAVYLHPAHVFASARPCAVTTILGSCVAIVLWDAGAGVGGLNHYLLPHWARPGDDALRFGNVAFERLIEELAAQGAVKKRLQAKVFGGACVLLSAEKGEHLGLKNVEVARSLLASARIPIRAEDVGGRQGRKLIVHTDTGDAWVKML